MKKLANKKFILIMMMFVLFAAGYINWRYDTSEEKTAKILGEAAYVNSNITVEENEEVKKQRSLREKARDETKEMLNEIINNPNSTNEGKKLAEQELIFLAKCIKSEVDCETILEQKGFKDVIVTITANSANVSVGKKQMTSTDVAQITETISATTEFSAEKIKILTSD